MTVGRHVLMTINKILNHYEDTAIIIEQGIRMSYLLFMGWSHLGFGNLTNYYCQLFHLVKQRNCV